MADQDFRINIKTLADLTGIKLTEQQLKALQTAAEQGNQKAIAALRQLSAAQKEAQSAQTTGFTGGLVGIGTFVSLVTGAINAVKRFNDEEMKVVEAAIKTQEKLRELGDSIVGIQDDAIHARYLGLLPLNVQLIELQKDFARLRTEQSLLNLPKQGEDWKKYEKELNGVETAIKRVTGALQEQDKQNAAAAEKAAEKEFKERESFAKGAVTSADMNVQAALRNEAEARRTKDQLFQKTAEDYKKGFTPQQRQEYEQLSTNKDVIQAIEDLKRDLIGIWR